MTTLTLQQAFEACQKNETAWLNCKAEPRPQSRNNAADAGRG